MEKVTKIRNYVKKTYVEGYGLHLMLVYEEPRRTNNEVESDHSGLKRKIKVAHPNIWNFLKHLKDIMVVEDVKLQ